MESGSELHICSKCYKEIPFTGENFIRTEGTSDNTGCDGAICVCHYSGIIKDSLIRFKFFNKPGYYRTFAKLLSGRILKVTDNKKFDIIISVPLHKSKELSRGYNQAYLISKALSREINIPEFSYLLERSRSTDAQSLLGKGSRKENVRGAFRVTDKDKVKDKSVLIVDDIMTTGCTVDECSRMLKYAGAKSVIAAVVASGRKY
jgi:competence protein ComFC